MYSRQWEGSCYDPYNHIIERRRKKLMAKKIVKVVKLQIPAGKANPAPPVGPALGQAGVNIPGFCSQFNERTKDKMGYILPVVISVYEDRSFTFVVKTPPASDLLLKACGIEKGSENSKTHKVGKITHGVTARPQALRQESLSCGECYRVGYSS